MQADKKTFTKAEVEVVRFDKTDIITTSVVIINQADGTSTEQVGGDCGLDD